MANQGFLSESKWKRLILLIKCIRGLYLIPSIVTDEVKVDWYSNEIDLEFLKKCNNWEYKNIESTIHQYEEHDNMHNTVVNSLAIKYKYNWPDEPVIFICNNIQDPLTYRLIDGNHRARRYIRENKNRYIKCFIGLVKGE